MNINTKKTNEMLFGSVLKTPPPLINFETGFAERVTSFKLVGLTITNNLNWDELINAISVKAYRRLHFLKLLKRSSVACDDLVCYKSLIRPVLE
jgi:hypothetical protein